MVDGIQELRIDESPLTIEQLADAACRAARKLGNKGFFLRVIATELGEHWLDPIRESEVEGGLEITVPHRCRVACGLSEDSCLTAIKAEEIISQRRKKFYNVETMKAIGAELVIRLVPASWP
jgi:hypothetical protein